MKPLLSATVAVLLAAVAGPAWADSVPNLDVEKTCRSAQVADSSVSDRTSYEGCLSSERSAKQQAEQRWGSFTAPAKRQCESQFKAGGYPSYVEMITCLELASGTVPTGSDDKNTAVGGSGTRRAAEAQRNGTENLTKEPSAAQRTDPIKVLNKD